MDNNEGAAPPSSPIDGAPDAGFVPSPLQALLVPTAPVNPPTTSSMGLSNGAQVSSDGEEEMEEEEEDEEDEDEEDEEEDEGRVSGDDEDDDDMGGGGSGAGAAGAAGASISEGTGPTGGPVRGVVRQRDTSDFSNGIHVSTNRLRMADRKASNEGIQANLPTTTPPTIYHIYQLARAREERLASEAVSIIRPFGTPPIIKDLSKKDKGTNTNNAQTKKKGVITSEAEERHWWKITSRDEAFVGPSFQEEFIRRRLLEVEDQLVLLSQKEGFQSVWEKEVVAPLLKAHGMEDQSEMTKVDDEHEDTGNTDTECDSSMMDDIKYETVTQVDDDQATCSETEGGSNGSKAMPEAFNACIGCKRIKKGCTRTLPSCARCIETGKQCDYDIAKYGFRNGTAARCHK